MDNTINETLTDEGLLDDASLEQVAAASAGSVALKVGKALLFLAADLIVDWLAPSKKK
jgi:hypothetical protein